MGSIVPLPNAPSRIEHVLDWARRVHDYLRANTLFDSPGVRLVSRYEGTTFDLSIGASETPTSPLPFDLTISTSDQSGVTASFVPGCGQLLVPENVLDDVEVPSGDLSYCFLELTTDGKKVQQCELKISLDAPDPLEPTMNTLPVKVQVPLHIIDYTPPVAPATVGTYTPYRVFWPAGNVILQAVDVFTSAPDDPQPGQLDVDTWRTWQVNSTAVD